eukprot:scaffold69019_cov31-Tisochrysis_lutea.AAC.2
MHCAASLRKVTERPGVRDARCGASPTGAAERGGLCTAHLLRCCANVRGSLLGFSLCKDDDAHRRILVGHSDRVEVNRALKL